MTCYHPQHGYYAKGGGWTRSRKNGYIDRPLDVPCGGCIGCRLDKSKQWAIRCMHEASQHKQNSYITLTYNDQNLPYDGSVNLIHFQNFIKRLRKSLEPKTIRFYHCGEYGDKTNRPHYHALIFGHEWPDVKYYKDTKNGDKLYTSESLNSKWGFGNCYIGLVTYESAGYCARYIMKKQTGKAAETAYIHIDEITGEIYERAPEYSTMSRRPGIGASWYAKYSTDLFPHDYCVVNGHKQSIPAFYATALKGLDEAAYNTIKGKRRRKANQDENNTPSRLAVRETVRLSKLNRLERSEI